jgi:8-oxo-dGTP pyrophosphatase MutT (NUDIX family)
MDDVRARLASRPARPPVDGDGLRRSAVLVPLFVREARLFALFTRRTETVEHHRGQISFPGGTEEEDDASLLETALRESEEEIGLRREDAIPLGSLSPMVTGTGFYVEPYVAAVPQPYVFRQAEAEIAEIIEAPVAALMDPAILETKPLPGRPEPVLFYHFGAHVIWGATARMLQELLSALSA